MQRKTLVTYLIPWKFKWDKMQQRIDALRKRDGDNCWRCKRPLNFDLPHGHDQAPTIEHLTAKPKGGGPTLDNVCLCHGRCNGVAGDSTAEVLERMRRKAEEPVAPKRRAAGGR